MTRIRKDARLLTQDERGTYVAAIKAMGPRYFEYSDLHADLGSDIHDHDIFLPWHRAFLLTFENALRDQTGYEHVTLPYWNWSDDALLDDPKTGVLWDDKFLGGKGSNSGYGPSVRAPQALQFSRINTGNFGGWKSQNRDLTRSLGRNGLGGLDPSSVNDTLVQIPHYETRAPQKGFRHKLEFGPHAEAHNWVGGTMANMSISPIDPSFWSLHGFVDLIYERWTRIAFGLSRPLFPDGQDDQMVRASPTRGQAVYRPSEVARCSQLDYAYDMLSFDEGSWDSLANLEADYLHATKLGFIMRFRLLSNGKYAADERKLLSDAFHDLPDMFRFGVDSMAKLPDGRVFMFKDAQFIVYDKVNTSKPALESGPISRLFGQNGPSKVDSICAYNNGAIYVTDGSKYWKYSQDASGLHLAADYPAAIADGWRGLTSDFYSGFDAVVQVRDGTIFVLRGANHARYTPKSYPRTDGKRPGPIAWRFVIKEDLVRSKRP